jgi:hypothetical protein
MTPRRRGLRAKESGEIGPKLMAMPAIRKAIMEKQRAAIAASGTRIGQRLSRLDVLKRLIELANLPPDCTRYNISGQVSALKVIAELEGYVIRRHEDLIRELADRTPEEKEFFATHGYFENEVEPQPPSPSGLESLGKDADQQN